MKLISAKTMVAEVVKTWRAQYFRDGKWTRCVGGSENIYQRLSALPETATADDVAAIIGNDTWAHSPACHECKRIMPAVVQLGEPPDYESHTASICVDCLKEAVTLHDRRQVWTP